MAGKAKCDIYPVFIPHGGCKNHCSFCDQRQITGRQVLPEVAQIEKALASPADGGRELAFYGGSFTGLPKDKLLSYLACGRNLKQAGKITALRCSTHPDAIDEETVALLKEYGMDRVELGVQSLDDAVLAAAGRGHGKETVFRSMGMLHDAGMEVGVQLLLGLPLDSREKSLASMWELLPYRPDFVRLYPLLVLADTALASFYQAGAYIPPTLDEALVWARDLLAFFSYHNIPVIRIGLQPGGEIYRGSPKILAGPYHESFGNLCKAALKLTQMHMLLSRSNGKTDLDLLAPRADLPLLFGYRRSNVERLRAVFPQLSFAIAADDTLARGDIALGARRSKGRRKRYETFHWRDFLEEYYRELAGFICI